MIDPRTIRRLIRLGALAAAVALSVAAWPAARAAAPAPALDPANLDTTCKACDDFWRYATGGWRARTKIPPGYPEWGSFDEVYERNLAVLHTILDDAAANAATTTDADHARVGVFYAACNDVGAVEANGLQALQPELDRINAIGTPAALVAEIARLDRFGVDDGLGFGPESDTRDSSKTIAGIGFGGLGMPDRDYYLAPRNAAIRAAYARYLVTQLTNLGEDGAAAHTHARGVIALETTLAKATPPNADLRDPLATYHPMAVAKLGAIAPHIAWSMFLASFGQPGLRSADVNLPRFTAVFDRQIVATPLDVWQAALRTHLVTAWALALPRRFDTAEFDFYDRTLQGTREQLPRWKRCAAATDAQLGDPLGKIYVARAFPPAAKLRAKRLVDTLQSALNDDLATLAWMSPSTRREAQRKLAAYTKKIGYPDHWIDFSSVTLAPSGPFAADLSATRAFAQRLALARIGKPTDRQLWGMTPPTVNAYYNPSNNEIVFPAGILQAPFFDEHADDAVVYGAIGAVIGHEMTHGFDDQGRQYDARGNLRDWWTVADAAHFKRRAQCIIDQFDAYQVAPGVHENGRLITGEAIADLGGTTIAYRAFTRTAQFRGHQRIDGYTPEQRYFLSYAQVWRELSTPQYDRQDVLVDPHPNNRFRLIGTLGNMPAFRAAFACAMNAPMIRHDRCEIW
jgi:putative endopeptidase